MTRGEDELSWLGTRRFWAVFGVVFAIGLAFLLRQRVEAGRENALVPVITLTGPEAVLAGGTARYAVLVRDRYGAPLPGASVRLGFWKAGFIELARGTSSDSGDAALEIKLPDDFKETRSLVAIAEAGVAEGTAQMDIRPERPGAPRVFISTDKPLYQPGQTIHVRALAMAGDTPLANQAATLEIRTPGGTKVFRAEKPTSAFGVVSHDFALAEQVQLGQYSINFLTKTADGTNVNESRRVEVKRYALPKLKVAIEDLDEVASPSAPVQGVARASWIFGEPVTKGAMTVTLERGGSLAQRVTGQVDKNGAFRFELHQGGSAIHWGTTTVRAAVEVEGGMKAETTKGVTLLATNAIKLEAFPEAGVLVPEVAQDVFVVVTHPKPESVVLRVKNVPGSEVKTSARGIATLRVTPPRGRMLEIEATGPGGSNGKLDLTTTLDRLAIRPDKTAYDAGGTIKLSVLGAEPGDRVALRVTKATEPLVTGMCTVAANGCEANVALPAKAEGLVWIHAVSLPGARREVRAGKRLVVVRGGSRDLDLKVTPDKAAYTPRETGNIAVAVTGAGGAPAQAQLGVAVADEAVFALADVRPDLEKKFFTTDKDLAYAQRGGWWYPHYSTPNVPSAGSHEATKVYDATTEDDVRAAILAALTTMPEPGGFEEASSSSVSQKARAAVEVQREKISARAIVFIAFMTMVLFAAFAAYGVARYRRPLRLVEDGDEAGRQELVRESRGLFVDWLSSVLGPPVLLFSSIMFAEVLFEDGYKPKGLSFGLWLSVALLAAIFVMRGVMRVRRLPTTKEAIVLRRALVLLPIATFLGHLTIVLVLVDNGNKLEHLFPLRQDAVFLPLLVVACAQLTFGFLTVIRQGSLRELNGKTRLWLLLSRASFLGLPLTLAALVVLLVVHVDRVRRIRWDEYTLDRRETEQSMDSADNKEGGTGTRAKGEEGSMGNPNAPSNGKRYAVAGPRANTEDAPDEKPRPGGGGKVVTVRDYFPETLLWAPEIITDDSGHAKVQVPFADSITTWRFGLRAVSKTGQLGGTAIPLIVKQDFFVEASLPPLLTQGDEIAVPVTVFGYTDQPQDVSIEVEGDGVATVGPSNMTLRLGKNETRGVRLVVRADKAGDRVVRIKANSPTRGDVLVRKVKIVPNGLEIVRPLNGRLQGGATVRADMPAGAIDGGNDLYVKIYGGPLSQVAEGLDGVFMMPHGCFEQSASVTYPSILALDFLVRSKAVSPEIETKARGYIADGYQRMLTFQAPGGGFSLYGSGPGSSTLTAYGLLELSDMARVANVDESLIGGLREWLFGRHTQTGGYKRFDTDTADSALATAYVTWALASYGAEKQPDARLVSLLDFVEQTNLPGSADPYGLALRANALLAGGRGDRAKLLLDKLASLALRTEEGVHWPSSESGVLHSYGMSLEVEVTGLAAHALARANRDADLRAGALDWLAARKGSFGTWSTTQATIAAMRAFLDEAKPAPKGPQQISVTVDGEKVDTYDMAPKARDVHHHVDLRRFAATGTHAVDIRATGEGDISYQLVSKHWLPWQKEKPAALGLDVIYAAHTVPVGGTTKVRARLSWTGKEYAVMPLVEIAVPPSFDAVESDLDAIVAKGGVRRWTMEHGKVTLYVADIEAEHPLDVEFNLRATRPAKVVAPASTAYLYYRPEVRTETAPVLLRAQ